MKKGRGRFNLLFFGGIAIILVVAIIVLFVKGQEFGFLKEGVPSDDNNSFDEETIISPEVSEEFCGISTEFYCDVDEDCMIAGCTSQVCQGVVEDAGATICDARECYDSARYGVYCQCVENKCGWN